MDTVIETEIKNIPLRFQTDVGLFSPGAVDTGTLAMLSRVDFEEKDKVLDLGCGYGVVGILAARLIGQEKVVLCDRLEKAVEYAGINAKRNEVPGLDIRLSDGFENIPDHDFTLILSNPPYHTDFSVAKHFIEEGFRHLALTGRLVMVTKRLEWYRNKIASVFGGVRVDEIDGYYVFMAEKRKAAAGSRKKKVEKTNKLSRKLQRRYGR